MANKSSTRITSSTPVGTVSVPAGAASGSSSGASVPGIGPASVIKPPKGFRNVVQHLVNGINKDIPADAPITVAGMSMTQAQFLAILMPVLAAFTAITDAESQVKQARLALSALLPQVRLFVDNLKHALIAQFGKGSPLLADFGVKDGAVRKKPTTKDTMAKVVKAGETRVLRHTQGKVAIQAVKFTGGVAPASAVVASGAPGGTSGSGNGNGSTGA